MVSKAFPSDFRQALTCSPSWKWSGFPSTSDLFPEQEHPSHEVASDQTGEGEHPAHRQVLRGRGFDTHEGEERKLDE